TIATRDWSSDVCSSDLRSRNTPTSHLQTYYDPFDEVREQKFDGMIVTGAPVEKLEYDQVDYIDELTDIINWAQTHVYSRFFICWGAQFALNHYFEDRKSVV